MSSSFSSSSSRIPQEKYHVFLSFRGEIRNSFTSHLYSALISKKIVTFIDDEELRRGDEISSSLIEAIETSLILVVVFSKSYASSRWCLDELEKILECKKIYGRIVIPVFYDVDPSDVRKQTGSYGDALDKHERSFRWRSEKLQKWRAALTEVANLSGWHSNLSWNEATLIKKIVKDILKRLNKISSNDKRDDLVGIDSKIKQIESLLSMSVRSVGIWGMGGIGKTTLARALFDKISSRFESHYFIEKIRETEEKSTLKCLRQELLSAILDDENIKVGVLNEGIGFLKERLRRKKVLIVLDDVTCEGQIKDLIGGLDWFGSRSRIIITSRDRKVLNNCRVDGVYKVEGLLYDDAMKLFCQNAFRENQPMTDYVELSHSVVRYIDGVPLGLKIFGSFLHGRTKIEMKSAVQKLKRIPHVDIQNVLKVSYNGLDDEEKSILLDIACLFNDRLIIRRHELIDIMDASGYHTEIGLSVLADKCLINKDTLAMHDLVRQMARGIVQQTTKDPSRHSRLWDHEDIYQVLRNNTGTEEIEGISLDMSRIKDIDLHPRAFAKMHNLRILNFYKPRIESNNVSLSQGLDSVFSELRYMRWDECPLKSLRPNLRSENLVGLYMPYSKVEELWHGVQRFPNLKYIDLHDSENLYMMPDFSHAQNLERLYLNGCTSLVEVHPSIQCLNKLVYMNLDNCKSLNSLPTLIALESLKDLFLSNCSNLGIIPDIPRNIDWINLQDCTMLKYLPNNISDCKSLSRLQISGCSKLDRLPENFGNLERLLLFEADRMELLKELPPSFAHLNNLGFFCFSNCNVQCLPNDFGQLSSLVSLSLSQGDFKSLPASIIDLAHLQTLDVSYCEWLQCLPNLPNRLNLLMAHECKSLEVISSASSLFKDLGFSSSFYKTIDFTNCFKLDTSTLENTMKQALLRTQLQKYRARGVSVCYWGSEIPEWFTFRSRGSCMTFDLQPDWYNENFIGFALCAVVVPADGADPMKSTEVEANMSVNCRCQFLSDNCVYDTIPLILTGRLVHCVGSDQVFLGYDFTYYTNLYYRYPDAKEVSFQFYGRDCKRQVKCCRVKQCGVHLLYNQQIEEPQPKMFNF